MYSTGARDGCHSFIPRLAPRGEFRLGAKPGPGGLNLHLGKNVMLFSTYEITSSGGAPPAGARTPEETSIGGYDFTYGLRLRY